MSALRSCVFAICISLVTLATLGCGDDTPTDSGGNTAPTAVFTISPASGGMGTVFEFDASNCTDAQDTLSVLEVRWDWENDGWDTGWASIKTATYRYDSPGTKTIKLEVRDPGGLTDDTTRTITVFGVGLPPMVAVPAGSFEMGDGTSWCGTEEHQVTLRRGFYLSKYEVTTKEYRDALQWAYDQDPKMVTCLGGGVLDAIDGSTAMLVILGPSLSRIYYSSDGDSFSVAPGYEDHPVTHVSWYGAVAYCDWLSVMEGGPRAYNHSTWECNGGEAYAAEGYRLPTDAEWEYVTQYAGKRKYPWGDEPPDCSRANYNCGPGAVDQTSPVGSYPGWTVVDGDSIYDMAGNVWEWCNDWHICDLGTASVEDPVGPTVGAYRVLRGSSWNFFTDGLPCAERSNDGPTHTYGHIGLRCARSR
jgi:formylglycine-generating enzyme required for sulfatase activity